MAPDGSFVITWRTSGGVVDGVFFQRFDPSGNPIGDETRVHSAVSDPQIDSASDGRFAIVWAGGDGDGNGIFAQRFASDGSPHDDPLWISQGIPGNQSAPRVAMNGDADLLVSWKEEDGTNSARWVSWDAPADAVPYGPWIRSQSPVQPVVGPIQSLDITFDRLIDPATFTPDDVELADPAGRNVTVTSVTTTDNMTFTIGFGAQQLPGVYQFHIGPNIADLSGLLMNEDGDDANGEFEDEYQAVFVIASTQSAAFPTVEAFEAGSVDELEGYWSFSVGAYATIGVVDTASPHGGAYHLVLDQAVNDANNYQEMVLLMDLSSQVGASNLELDFWAKKLSDVQNHLNTLSLYVSGDGNEWTEVGGGPLTPPGTTYGHYAFDLDQAMSSASPSIVFDSDVYLKFRHFGRKTNCSMTLDDIRVSNVDAFGPQVTSHTPTGLVTGPIWSVDVTFDEEMDGSSFTTADITVTGPVGNAVALDATTPITDLGDHRTFTIHLAGPQGLAGLYDVTVGPDILDLAGNVMNQNGDNLQGDGYTGTFDIGAQPAIPPLIEDFEAGSIGGLGAHWSFSREFGTISVVNTNANTGTYALQMYADRYGYVPWSNRNAVLHVDLYDNDAETPLTDVTLDFWVKQYTGNTNGNVSISVNGGTSWTALQSINGNATSSYQHYAFDLDSYGLTYTDDVWIKFNHTNYYAGGFVWDDIRVSSADVNVSLVVGRHVFYNNSKWDGHAGFAKGDPAANEFDDGAIATDKTALLPGQTGTFANYTSYPRGINGIMVDVQGLADPIAVADGDLSEFVFKYGNDDTPDDWLLAPVPVDVDVRDLGGDVHRVTFIWADSAIPNKNWLQVTVKAGANTGLAADDVFYFGNTIGENTGDFRVDYSDAFDIIWPLLGTPLAIGPDHVADINRDGRIDYSDVFDDLWPNLSGPAPLKPIHPPALPAAPLQSTGSVFNEKLSWEIELIWLDQLYGTSSGSGDSEEDDPLEATAVDGVFSVYYLE
jgi:hypothetical protein